MDPISYYFALVEARSILALIYHTCTHSLCVTNIFGGYGWLWLSSPRVARQDAHFPFLMKRRVLTSWPRAIVAFAAAVGMNQKRELRCSRHNRLVALVQCHFDTTRVAGQGNARGSSLASSLKNCPAARKKRLCISRARL